MNILKKSITVNNELKSSDIFRILQEVSAQHCGQFNLSMERLYKEGLMWVVVRQYVHMERYPKAGESLNIETWPGATRHMMFPRFYLIRDSEGEIILKASAIWTIVDRQSRKMIMPQSYGLGLEGIETGDECRLPMGIKKQELKNISSFIVPEEYIDSNKHMNNTCYYDAAEKCFENEISGKHLKEAVTEYVSEAVLGEELKILWDEIDDRIFVNGENQGTVFKMNLLYE